MQITFRHTLLNRFLLRVVPLLLLIFMGTALLIAWSTHRELTNSLENRLVSIATAQADVLSKPLWNFDLDYVQLNLQALVLDTDIAGAEVSSDGSILASAGAPQKPHPLYSLPSLQRPIAYTTFQGETRVGELVLHPSTERIETALAESLTRSLILLTVLAGSFAALVMLAFRTTIGEPLSRLYRAIRMADEKRIRRPVNWESEDELGTVIKSYNHMLVTLADREEALTRASMMKTAFLANMSHEIRTPMNTILGMAELLSESEELTREQHDYVTTLTHSGQALLETIDDILDISKIESGQMELEAIAFSLVETVESACAMVGFRAHEKTLDLSLSIHPDLFGIVRGDPVRLRQVLVNLLGNAIKFTDRGRVTLACEPEDERHVRLVVEDTGIGIPEDRQESIFDMFTQADSSTTREFGGTGLGLAISRRLVELMGGSISLSSSTGKGSTFAVSLPMPVVQPPENKPVAELAGVGVLAATPNSTRAGYLRALLEHWGMNPQLADEDRSAVHLAMRQQPPPRVVLVDTALGAQQAKVIIEKLSAMAEPPPKIILMSGNESLTVPEALTGLGVADTIRTPLRQAELMRSLLAHVRFAPQDWPEDADPGPAPDFSDLRLLLVEDSEANRELVRLYLEPTGATLVEAANGEEALALFGGQCFHAILMDLQMPVMDGFEATRKLRAWCCEHDRPLPPVVAVTADVFKETRTKCLALGFSHYLTKPLRKKLLLKTLALACGQVRAEESARTVFHVEEVFRPLIPKLLAGAGQALDEMEAALRSGDTRSVLDDAHTFKGTFGGYGMPELSALFADIERLTRQGCLEQVPACLERTRETMRQADIRYISPEQSEPGQTRKPPQGGGDLAG